MQSVAAAMAFPSHLGHKAALRMFGDSRDATIFAELPFETRPLYSDKSWFIPPMMLYY